MNRLSEVRGDPPIDYDYSAPIPKFPSDPASILKSSDETPLMTDVSAPIPSFSSDLTSILKSSEEVPSLTIESDVEEAEDPTEILEETILIHDDDSNTLSIIETTLEEDENGKKGAFLPC